MLVTLIKIDSYDVALKLIREYPELATARDRNDETALHALAGKSMSSSNRQGILHRFFSLFPITKSGINKKPAQQAGDKEKLVEEIWSYVVGNLDRNEISKLISHPFPLIFHAAGKENIEFLRKLADKLADILWEVDKRKQTIFHVAVYNRQKKIVKLLSEMRSQNDPRVFLTDENGNTILHLAAMVQGNDIDGSKSNNYNPNNDGSSVIFGTAFQLQQRLRWFKEVRNILPPATTEARNKYSQTPRDLFDKAYGNLMKDGQKWMKETANSCMVVATLVATVAFAAAFAIPGGNKGDTGVPIFVEEVSFKVFAISDAAALVFSTISVLTFLFMHSSTYSAEYFLWQLPKSLMVGLGSLLLSIAAMMVVFSSTFFIVFHGRMPWVPILVAVVSSMPVILFIPQHYSFLVNVCSFHREKELN